MSNILNKNSEKEYTILFGKNKTKNDTSTYFYLTRFYIRYEKRDKCPYIFGKNYYSEGTLQEESTSYEPIRTNTKEDDFYYFSLEEVQRILKKLRKKISKRNKNRKIYKEAARNTLNKYAYGKEPFIVKRTKIKQYLKD